jgi:hypothetical protein
MTAMPRRNYRTAKAGQLYAAEWPEWHVNCARGGCEAHALVAGIGEAYTAVEAEKLARSNDAGELNGWKRIKGLWYCPDHVKEDRPCSTG